MDFGKPFRLAIVYVVGIAVGWSIGTRSPYMLLVSLAGFVILTVTSIANSWKDAA